MNTRAREHLARAASGVPRYLDSSAQNYSSQTNDDHSHKVASPALASSRAPPNTRAVTTADTKRSREASARTDRRKYPVAATTSRVWWPSTPRPSSVLTVGSMRYVPLIEKLISVRCKVFCFMARAGISEGIFIALWNYRVYFLFLTSNWIGSPSRLDSNHEIVMGNYRWPLELWIHWMNEWMNVWMNEWMNKRTSVWMQT